MTNGRTLMTIIDAAVSRTDPRSALSPEKCRALRQRRGHGETLDVRADSKPARARIREAYAAIDSRRSAPGSRPRNPSRAGTHMFLRLPTIVRASAWVDFGARHLDGDTLLQRACSRVKYNRHPC